MTDKAQPNYQSFLAGPTLHLRGLEKDDAATEAWWRPSPWIRSTEHALDEFVSDRIAESNGGRYLLVACRNHDGLVLGSLTVWSDDWQWIFVTVFVSPMLDPRRAGAIRAEILTLAMPFLTEERGGIAAFVETPDDSPEVEAAMADIGAHRCYRLREAMLIDGKRIDSVGYGLFNAIGVERHGLPAFPPEGLPPREVRSPASLHWPVIDPPPDGATAIGERLYLRAVREEDAAAIAQAALEESETWHDTRWPRSGSVSVQRYRNSSESEPPENVSFAIVRRDTDELIGTNDLAEIDLVNGTAETGTHLLRPEFRGVGYGTEAKHLLLSYAFDRLGLHMVRSFVWEINHRSAAALLRQGYREAGSIPWRGLHHAIPSGDLVFDLLADEWRRARR